MANAKTVTLVANTAQTVKVGAWDYGVWVENLTAGQVVWVRLDGTDPTVAGDDSYAVTGARNFPIAFTPSQNGSVDVRMISSGTPVVAVSGIVKSTAT